MILSCFMVLKHDYIQTYYYLKLEQCCWVSKLHSMLCLYKWKLGKTM